MLILGSVENGVLIVHKGEVLTVNSDTLKNTFLNENIRTVKIANIGTVSKDVKSDFVFTKAGDISNKYVSSLKLANVQRAEVVGSCNINGIDLGDVLLIKAMSEEKENRKKVYQSRVILYFSGADVVFNCYDTEYEDLKFIFSNPTTFKLYKGVSEGCRNFWTYGIASGNTLITTRGTTDVVYRFIKGLIDTGVLPDLFCVNLSVGGLTPEKEKGKKFSGYIGEFETAWKEMETGTKDGFSKVEVVKEGISYRILYHKDYTRDHVKLGALLSVLNGKVLISEVIGVSD